MFGVGAGYRAGRSAIRAASGRAPPPVRMPRLVDGQHADFCAAAVLRDADGLPLGTLSIYDRQPRELSARQRAQLQALARQAMALLELRRICNEQARSRQIIDSAQNYAIIATDLRGLVTSWNSGAQQLLGWSEDEVCGRHVELMFTEQDRAADAPEQEMRTALSRAVRSTSAGTSARMAHSSGPAASSRRCWRMDSRWGSSRSCAT